MNTRTLLPLLVVILGAPAYAQDRMTGMFRLSQTTAEILDPQTAATLNDIIPMDETLDWQVFVPVHYNPERPPGVIVYADPNGWGGMPDAYRQVVTDSNLIWIGPKKNELRPSSGKKVWSAILSLRVIEQQYAVDLNRVYIVSLADEALTAIHTLLSANEFRGAVYMRGSVFWTSIEPDQLEALRRKRHVFITGTNDKLKQRIRNDVESYEREGIHDVKLVFSTKTLGNPPKPEFFAEAIRYLDGN